MKPIPVWQISILTSREAEEAVLDLLNTITGQPASSYEDLETATCRVSVYLTRKPAVWPTLRRNLADGLDHIRASGLNPLPALLTLNVLGRKNWAESWKRHFKAMRLGKALLIRPTWSRARAVQGQAEVLLNPGLSFGTGQHPTTGFCLSQIVEARKRASGSFLDVGTGSGILAICACKLGFAPVLAFDNDPEAVRVAAENARKNRVIKRIQLRRGDLANMSLKPRMKFDLVCGNLMANLLLEHRQRLVACVRPGGTLVLAGILATEFDPVKTAFEECGAKFVAGRTEKEWCSGAFRIRRDSPPTSKSNRVC